MFSLTSFGNLQYDCVIKTRETINFRPLINKSVTILLRFLYVYKVFFVFYVFLRISAIISSKTIKIFRFLSGLYSLTSL